MFSADNQTINAFALPGGQVFITDGLLKRLKTPGQWPACWGTKSATWSTATGRSIWPSSV